MAKRRRKKAVNLLPSLSTEMYMNLGMAATAIIFIFTFYKVILQDNISFSSSKYYYLITEEYSIHDFADTLEANGIIESSLSLRLMAELRGFSKVRKGLFTMEKGWNNYQLISHLKEDSIRPHVFVKVPAYKLRKNVVETVADYFPNINKMDIWGLLRDKKFLDSLGFSRENVFTIFLPGKYVLPKEMTAREFLEAMHIEYSFFWNHKRLKKASRMDLSPEEATILASIVYSETKLKEEMPSIAGVYYNRLQKGMRLQSDPTVIYAAHKFGAKRVYFADRKINSKYNTYRNYGLPPGPIHITPPYVIDAVLNYKDHEYLYFCAKDDLSGCHLFSKSFKEHKENANAYRKALDKAGIF